MTSGLKDNLVAVMTVLEDLCDLEATAITTYVTALKVSSDPETLTLIEVETTAERNLQQRQRQQSRQQPELSNPSQTS